MTTTGLPQNSSRLDWRASLPVLQSSRVTLRDLRAGDAASLLEMVSDPEMEQYLAPGPDSVEAFERFIQWSRRARTGGRYVCFGIVPAGVETAAGLFQIWPLEPGFGTAEWGFALARPYWGTGMFSASGRLLVDFAIEVLGVRRLEARVALQNQRGNGALERLGAVREGVLRRCFKCGGEYRDHVMWSILADDWRTRKQATDGDTCSDPATCTSSQLDTQEPISWRPVPGSEHPALRPFESF